MNNTIDCTGMACPLPVVNAKKAFAGFSEDGELTVLVDNPTAVENLKKLAASSGFSADEALGKTLMKAFIFALTNAQQLPEQIIFYNSGAFLPCEGSDSLEDLQNLEKAGVKITACGTCLNYYGLTEKLRVGTVSNMYDIVETLTAAQSVIRP